MPLLNVTKKGKCLPRIQEICYHSVNVKLESGHSRSAALHAYERRLLCGGQHPSISTALCVLEAGNADLRSNKKEGLYEVSNDS
jgi:hypothetical protein